jgi:hypothetical protein
MTNDEIKEKLREMSSGASTSYVFAINKAIAALDIVDDIPRVLQNLKNMQAAWEDKSFSDRNIAEAHISALRFAIRQVEQLHTPEEKEKIDATFYKGVPTNEQGYVDSTKHGECGYQVVYEVEDQDLLSKYFPDMLSKNSYVGDLIFGIDSTNEVFYAVLYLSQIIEENDMIYYKDIDWINSVECYDLIKYARFLKEDFLENHKEIKK